ncbi:MAG: tetratricopeptide repeat protein, partial [Prolixibacteraceae bacterium]|nr:tetratricopeptide repeat protein [Prolixibacteraceae bacterium]
MAKKSKTIFYIAGGTIVIAVIVAFLVFNSNGNIKSQIPVISNLASLPKALKEQISAAIKKAQEDPTPENLGTLGMVYHSSANYEEAGKCYDLAILTGKKTWIWNYYAGYLNMELGNSEAAVKNFKEVVKKNPKNGLAYYYLGQEYKNLRENDKAEENLNIILTFKSITVDNEGRKDHFPLGTYAKFQLARIYVDTEHNDLAEQKLKEIIKTDYLFGPAYRLLGNIYRLNGDTTLSNEYTVRANDLGLITNPIDNYIDRLILMSRSELYILKRIDEAERGIYPEWTLRIVENALKFIPDNKYLLSKAIKIYLWSNQDQVASDFIKKHISSFSDNLSELKKTGIFFFQKGLYQQAMQYWDVALKLNPEEEEVIKNKAISYWALGNRQEANRITDQLLEKNRNNPDKLADVVYLAYHLGQKQKVLQHFEQLKKQVPTNLIVQKLAGEMAESNGEFSKAVAHYEVAFKGNPEDLQTISYLGNLLFKYKRWDKYITHYREALKYHPNDPEIIEKVGDFLINCPNPTLKNMEEGKKFCERAFTHITSTPDIQVSAGRNLAIACALTGEKQKAVSTLSRTINIA